MAKSKKSEKKKPVNVHDMKPGKDPKGGALASSVLKKKDDTVAAVIAKI